MQVLYCSRHNYNGRTEPRAAGGLHETVEHIFVLIYGADAETNRMCMRKGINDTIGIQQLDVINYR